MTAAVTAAYAYHAVRADGAMERGVIHAVSRDAALTAVRERGLLPVTVRAHASTMRGWRAQHRVPPADLAIGLRILSDLLDSGMPMGRALAAFEELAPPSWTPGMTPLRAAVRDGKSLTAAFQTSGLDLPPLVLGVMQAGEAGSGLALAVRRAAELTETAAATRAAIRGALAYPMILALAGVSAVGLLIGVVLPRFATILGDMGHAMPPSTQMLMTLAQVVTVGAVPGLIVLVCLVALWRVWIATPSGAVRWHTMLLSVPGIGRIRHATATAHAAGALATLMESGVPLPTALTHAARASGNSAIERRLTMVRERVLGGERVGTAIAATQAMTPTAVRLVRAGEDTGRLAAMLRHTAKLEGERAQQLVKQGVRLLEPVLILVFGAMIAFVAAALLQAVYSVRPT